MFNVLGHTCVCTKNLTKHLPFSNPEYVHKQAHLFCFNNTLQVDEMYQRYLDKLKNPLLSTLPARELWTEIDRDTVTMGSLVSLIPRPIPMLHIEKWEACNIEKIDFEIYLGT